MSPVACQIVFNDGQHRVLHAINYAVEPVHQLHWRTYLAKTRIVLVTERLMAIFVPFYFQIDP